MKNLKLTPLFIAGLVIIVCVSAFLFLNQRDQNETTETNLINEQSTQDSQLITNECTGIATPLQTEGPYYKVGSPERKKIVDNLPGEKLIVTGYVFDQNCEPLVNAWVDFWQASADGNYDNAGFNLRGHQYTDSNGAYKLETIIPREYGNRPAHIHVKIRPQNGETITSQLYFPESPQNESDSIFNEALIMNLDETQSPNVGQFNFVVNN